MPGIGCGMVVPTSQCADGKCSQSATVVQYADTTMYHAERAALDGADSTNRCKHRANAAGDREAHCAIDITQRPRAIQFLVVHRAKSCP